MIMQTGSLSSCGHRRPAGVPVDNVTLLEPPKLVGIDQVNADQEDTSSGGGLAGWAVALIVVAILLVLPVPSEWPCTFASERSYLLQP